MKDIDNATARAVEGWRNFYSSELDAKLTKQIFSEQWKSFQNKTKGSNVAIAQAVEASARQSGKEVRVGFQQRRARGKSPAAGARAESTPPRGGGGPSGEGGGWDEGKGWDTAGPRAKCSAAAKRAASAKRSPPAGGGSPAGRKCAWGEQLPRQTFYSEPTAPAEEFADGGTGVKPVSVHTFYEKFPIESDFPRAAVLPENWRELRMKTKPDQRPENEKAIEEYITQHGVEHAFVADDLKAKQGFSKRGVLVNGGKSVIKVKLTDLADQVRTTPNILKATSLKEITLQGKKEALRANQQPSDLGEVREGRSGTPEKTTWKRSRRTRTSGSTAGESTTRMACCRL